MGQEDKIGSWHSCLVVKHNYDEVSGNFGHCIKMQTEVMLYMGSSFHGSLSHGRCY